MDNQFESVVAASLFEKAELYEKKNAEYGDSYHMHGKLMKIMFPEGVTLNSVDDFNRWGVFIQIMTKICRYVNSFETGGHDDSLDDLSVYAMMLKELDNE